MGPFEDIVKAAIMFAAFVVAVVLAIIGFVIWLVS